MKWRFKQLLIKITLGILIIYAATMTISKFTEPKVDTYKVITQEEQVSSSEVIISQEMVLSKLQQESQIVSMSQTLEETFTHVDEGLLGDRVTELNVKGKLHMGLDTSKIKVNYIDSTTGIVHIELPEPKLIFLDLPFDNVEFDKTNGWMRLSMSDEEEKMYFKSVKKSIEKDISKNEEILETANLHNQKVVTDILKLINNVNAVVFE